MRAGLEDQVGEQNASYRKGLVLGLTMAEVGILIIFVLLLLIATEQLRRDEINQQFAGKVPIEEPRLQALEKAEAALIEAQRALGVDSKAPEDDFIELVRSIASIAKKADGQSALDELKRLQDEMREATRQIEAFAENAKLGDPEAIAESARKQSQQIANQEGQLARYEKQLTKAGLGKGERPCWVQPDGTIDYLYDVVLGSNGIRMKEIEHSARVDERRQLHLPKVSPDEALSDQEFLSRTESLYNYGLAENCRFFVVIYDGTEVHEKLVYKNRLKTVEGHFYKRLSGAVAPF